MAKHCTAIHKKFKLVGASIEQVKGLAMDESFKLYMNNYKYLSNKLQVGNKCILLFFWTMYIKVHLLGINMNVVFPFVFAIVIDSLT